MENVKIGILVMDKDFGVALAKGISMTGRKIEIHLLQQETDENAMDLILSDQKNDRKNTVYLSQDKEDEIYIQDGPYSIYRYTDSVAMTDAIYYCYFKLTGNIISLRGQSHCHLIEGISLSGGTGTTMTLISTAKMLYRTYGSKCLYLSLTPFNTVIYGEDAVKPGSFLKLLYYLKEGQDFPIRSFITETEDVDYLAAGIFNSHYGQFNLEFLISLLKRIDAEGKYDFLMLDIGNHFTKETIALLEVSEGILFICEKNQREIEKYFPQFSREIAKWQERGNVCQIFSISEESEETVSSFNISVTNSFNLNENYGTEIGRIVKWIGENIGYEKAE